MIGLKRLEIIFGGNNRWWNLEGTQVASLLNFQVRVADDTRNLQSFKLNSARTSSNEMNLFPRFIKSSDIRRTAALKESFFVTSLEVSKKHRQWGDREKAVPKLRGKVPWRYLSIY